MCRRLFVLAEDFPNDGNPSECYHIYQPLVNLFLRPHTSFEVPKGGCLEGKYPKNSGTSRLVKYYDLARQHESSIILYGCKCQESIYIIYIYICTFKYTWIRWVMLCMDHISYMDGLSLGNTNIHLSAHLFLDVFCTLHLAARWQHPVALWELQRPDFLLWDLWVSSFIC